ncbi:hypothetical protein HYV86_01905 [Candidatus Woesearchaeota archaeon]|nr:hypothetical protein [Candidatus Woesearchaeota archaeon]
MTIIVSVGGPSAAGKTTCVDALYERLSQHCRVGKLSLDDCYRDLVAAGLSTEQRCALEINTTLNWDHPDIIDWEKPTGWYTALAQGKSVTFPKYCFATHSFTQIDGSTREESVQGDVEVVLVEGHLLLYFPEIRNHSDRLYFVDSPKEVSIVRRFQRDLCERRRSPESVLAQLESTVLPMQDQFIAPCAYYEGVRFVPWYDNDSAVAQLRSLANGHGFLGYIKQQIQEEEANQLANRLFMVAHPAHQRMVEKATLYGVIEGLAEDIYSLLGRGQLPRERGRTLPVIEKLLAV